MFVTDITRYLRGKLLAVPDLWQGTCVNGHRVLAMLKPEVAVIQAKGGLLLPLQHNLSNNKPSRPLPYLHRQPPTHLHLYSCQYCCSLCPHLLLPHIRCWATARHAAAE
jgi:hypothetical protein